MADITCLGYYVMGVSDLKEWRTFAEDILGLMVSYEDDEYMTLRADEYEMRIALEKNGLDDFMAAGWLLDNETVLQEYLAQLEAKGVKVRDGGPELAKRRRVTKIYVADDPNGFRHEFYTGPQLAEAGTPFQSKVLNGPGFVTGRLGIGHFVPVVQDYPATVDFFVNKLGLRVSDYFRREIQPGVFAEAAFLHTVTGRHHSVAIMHKPNFPKRIRHIMLQVHDLFDLGLAYERTKKSGKLAKEIGQHGNDHMLSFYVWTPSNIMLEYGWGGIVIDDSNWNIQVHTSASVWGHKLAGQGLYT